MDPALVASLAPFPPSAAPLLHTPPPASSTSSQGPLPPSCSEFNDLLLALRDEHQSWSSSSSSSHQAAVLRFLANVLHSLRTKAAPHNNDHQHHRRQHHKHDAPTDEPTSARFETETALCFGWTAQCFLNMDSSLHPLHPPNPLPSAHEARMLPLPLLAPLAPSAHSLRGDGSSRLTSMATLALQLWLALQSEYTAYSHPQQEESDQPLSGTWDALSLLLQIASLSLRQTAQLAMAAHAQQHSLSSLLLLSSSIDTSPSPAPLAVATSAWMSLCSHLAAGKSAALRLLITTLLSEVPHLAVPLLLWTGLRCFAQDETPAEHRLLYAQILNQAASDDACRSELRSGVDHLLSVYSTEVSALALGSAPSSCPANSTRSILGYLLELALISTQTDGTLGSVVYASLFEAASNSGRLMPAVAFEAEHSLSVWRGKLAPDGHYTPTHTSVPFSSEILHTALDAIWRSPAPFGTCLADAVHVASLLVHSRAPPAAATLCETFLARVVRDASDQQFISNALLKHPEVLARVPLVAVAVLSRAPGSSATDAALYLVERVRLLLCSHSSLGHFSAPLIEAYSQYCARTSESGTDWSDCASLDSFLALLESEVALVSSLHPQSWKRAVALLLRLSLESTTQDQQSLYYACVLQLLSLGVIRGKRHAAGGATEAELRLLLPSFGAQIAEASFHDWDALSSLFLARLDTPLSQSARRLAFHCIQSAVQSFDTDAVEPDVLIAAEQACISLLGGKEAANSTADLSSRAAVHEGVQSRALLVADALFADFLALLEERHKSQAGAVELADPVRAGRDEAPVSPFSSESTFCVLAMSELSRVPLLQSHLIEAIFDVVFSQSRLSLLLFSFASQVSLARKETLVKLANTAELAEALQQCVGARNDPVVSAENQASPVWNLSHVGARVVISELSLRVSTYSPMPSAEDRSRIALKKSPFDWDRLVGKAFDDLPFLWHVLWLVAEVPPLLGSYHSLIKSLLQHFIGYWNAVPFMDPGKSPLYLQNTVYLLMILVKWQKCPPSVWCLSMLLPRVSARQIAAILLWVNDLVANGDTQFSLCWDAAEGGAKETAAAPDAADNPKLLSPGLFGFSRALDRPRHAWSYKLKESTPRQLSPALAEPIKKLLLANMKMFGKYYPILFPPSASQDVSAQAMDTSSTREAAGGSELASSTSAEGASVDVLSVPMNMVD